MTTTVYNRIKKALVEQRKKVTASPAAANRFLDESGLKQAVPTVKVAPKKKAAAPKATSKKA